LGSFKVTACIEDSGVVKRIRYHVEQWSDSNITPTHSTRAARRAAQQKKLDLPPARDAPPALRLAAPLVPQPGAAAKFRTNGRTSRVPVGRSGTNSPPHPRNLP